MKPGLRRTLAVCLILAASLLFGLIYDRVVTGIEYRQYPRSYAEIVEEYAGICGIPQPLLYAVIQTESGFRASLCTEDGSVGLMQITEATYREICGIMPGENTQDPAVLYDPVNNIRSGAYWLNYLYVRYGNWEAALAAYHAGTDAVDEWMRDPANTDEDGFLIRIPDKSTETYVSKVQKTRDIYQRLYPNQ